MNPSSLCVCFASPCARAGMERLNFPVNFSIRKITLSFLDLWSELKDTWPAVYCRWKFEGNDQICVINHFVIAFPGWAFVILFFLAAWTRFWTNQCWLHLPAMVLLLIEILIIWWAEKKCIRVKKKGKWWVLFGPQFRNWMGEQLETFAYFCHVKCLKYLHSKIIARNQMTPSVPTVGQVI